MPPTPTVCIFWSKIVLVYLLIVTDDYLLCNVIWFSLWVLLVQAVCVRQLWWRLQATLTFTPLLSFSIPGPSKRISVCNPILTQLEGICNNKKKRRTKVSVNNGQVKAKCCNRLWVFSAFCSLRLVAAAWTNLSAWSIYNFFFEEQSSSCFQLIEHLI